MLSNQRTCNPDHWRSAWLATACGTFFAGHQPPKWTMVHPPMTVNRPLLLVVAGGYWIIWLKQCHKPPIGEWFIAPIYGIWKFGGVLLLFYPHYTLSDFDPRSFGAGPVSSPYAFGTSHRWTPVLSRTACGAHSSSCCRTTEPWLIKWALPFLTQRIQAVNHQCEIPSAGL